MADYHCAECGKYGYGEPAGGPAGGSRRPNGWVQNKAFGFGIKYYCSNKCKKEAEGASSSPTAGANQSQAERKYVEPPVQKSAEQIRAEHEVEMEERRIRREEEAQAAAERKIKAQKYRDKGQNFIAWLVGLSPVYSISLFLWPFFFLFAPGGLKLIGILSLLILILLVIKDLTKISWKIFGIVILSLLTLMIVYVKYTEGASERAKQEQVEKNAELEKIETDIILGINSGEDKKKLLDLVSQLQFEESSEDVVDNFVEGKKNGIIKTDKTSEEGPDDDFRGTYSEYWTAKREAYKEIIMSGVKIEDYIEKIRKEKQTTIVAPETNKSEEIEFTEAQDEIMVEAFADKVYFYDKPNAESMTKGYFVKGQQAKLLGAAGDFSKVRFEFNGKVTEKFVLTYQISEINTNSPTEYEEEVDPEYQETSY